MATKITYTDKVKTVDLPNPAVEKFRADDANEVKAVVNSNADELNSLDGTNIELIKGGGVVIDAAVTDLYASKVDSVNGDTSNDIVLDGNDIDWNNNSGITVKSKIESLDLGVLGNTISKVELGGDIGGSVSNPTINDEAITNAKLAHIATNRIKGRSAAGNGDVEDLTVPQTKSMLSIDQVDNTSDADKPISIATADALNILDLDLTSLDSAKISKNVGTTYTTNALNTVTQAEYDALTPDATTIYFIV